MVIVGCICNYPTLSINDFTIDFFFSFITEIAKRFIQKNFSIR